MLPMQDTFTVTQDFGFGEYLNFSLYLLPRTKMIRRLAIYLTCLGILVGLLSLPGAGSNKTIDLGVITQSFLPLAGLLLFFLLFYPLFVLYIVRFKPHIIRGITYRFTHWGMERIGTKTEATIPWRDFQKLKETKSFILLYVKETVKENKVDNIHVIQKRMFASPEAAREFQEFLNYRLPL